MRILLIVDSTERWPLDIPGVELVTAREYLADTRWSECRGAVVFNLCRSYAYQREGYYVSLLAEARGHRPQPGVATLQDLSQPGAPRASSEEFRRLLKRHLGRLQSDEFVLSVYFRRPLARTHAALAQALYDLYPSPMLRAKFQRSKDHEWHLRHVGPIAADDIPPNHRDFVIEAAEQYFATRRWSPHRRRPPRYHLAILHDPEEQDPPSNARAMERFERAAQKLRIGTERIEQRDRGRLAEFDGLFIRTTTRVNHFTYRFARRAAAEGLVVIDDPLSIIRCTNKVYLKELLERRGIQQPRSRLLHREGGADGLADLGFPCVLKEPDGSFSRGVVKVESPKDAEEALARMFAQSSMVLAQAFVPTEFDWRIGVLDGKPFYACRYFMARGHWQIVRREEAKPTRYGNVETLPVEDAPPPVVRQALKAAHAVGDGLYGVDIKQSGRDLYVIEVNDNPTIDAGYEDKVLGHALYERLMQVFLSRMEERRAAGGRGE